MSTQYKCIVIDPPWPEYGGGGRGAQNHYALMSPPEIYRLVARADAWRPAPDAHLWVWTTDNYLAAALGLIDCLGFTFKRTFCWVKMSDAAVSGYATDVAGDALQIGLGQYARGAHELCLFATSGKALVPEPENRPPSVLFAPRREHSRKPDECFASWFEMVSPGPRLEMFARQPRQDWDTWGNETGKFEAVAP